MLFTISGFSVFAMILPAGFVIDKVGRKWATVPSTGIPAIAFLLIPFAKNFFQLAVLISFLGIANGLSLGSLATSTFDVVPAARARPAASGAPHSRRDRRRRRAVAGRLSRRQIQSRRAFSSLRAAARFYRRFYSGCRGRETLQTLGSETRSIVREIAEAILWESIRLCGIRQSLSIDFTRILSIISGFKRDLVSMKYQTDDLRIKEIKELLPPAQLLADFPITDKAARDGLRNTPGDSPHSARRR